MEISGLNLWIFAPLAQAIDGEMQSEIRSVCLDPKLNQATIIEDVASISLGRRNTAKELR